jgi:hypothetical protein
LPPRWREVKEEEQETEEEREERSEEAKEKEETEGKKEEGTEEEEEIGSRGRGKVRCCRTRTPSNTERPFRGGNRAHVANLFIVQRKS